MLKITGGDITKVVRLNPYKRITKGTLVQCIVNGAPNEVIQDKAGKYTYLNVDGVDYYMTGLLAEGGEYATEEHVPAVKEAPAEGAEVKPKRARKAKAAEPEQEQAAA